MKRDTKIFELIEQERNRQLHGIELIASENFVSEQVMQDVTIFHKEAPLSEALPFCNDWLPRRD